MKKPIIFVDYWPDPDGKEVERLRLLLSTFQDGSGGLARKLKEKYSLPYFRDFERTIAVLVNGVAGENKHIFDVQVETSVPNQYIGFSCKMRGTLAESERKQDATIEVSNSNRKLWQGLVDRSIIDKVGSSEIYNVDPKAVGYALIETIESWYSAVDVKNGGKFLVQKSPMLHLAYHRPKRRFQLFCFSNHLPSIAELSTLDWKISGKRIYGSRLGNFRKIEWYFSSGGQLKYYPSLNESIWQSSVFTLEDLDGANNQTDMLSSKAAQYFPEQWQSLDT